MAQVAAPPAFKLGGSGSKPLSSLPAMGTFGTPGKTAGSSEQDGTLPKKKKKSLKGDVSGTSSKKSVDSSSLIAAVEQGGPPSSKDASGDNSTVDINERDSLMATVSGTEATTKKRKSKKGSEEQKALKGNLDNGALVLTALPNLSTPGKQKKTPNDSQSALKSNVHAAPEETAGLIASEETVDEPGTSTKDEDMDLEERSETEVEGGFYSGQWRGSTRHGMGKLRKNDGRIYEGCFVNGRVHGYGKFTAENGVFEGQWLEDQAHGQGVYDHKDGSRYVGQWERDKKSGDGVETWADGSHFKGQFLNGFKHGAGFYLSASGTSYDGQFANDKMDGHGSYKFPDGRAHIGQFRDGHMNGSGSMEWPNGCKYTGSYVNDMKHGEGTFKWADGRAYHGQWQRGKQHGNGVLVKKEGQEVRAVWHEGKAIEKRGENISPQPSARQSGRTSSVSTSPSKKKPSSPGSDGSSDEGAGNQQSGRANADLALVSGSRNQSDLMLLAGNRWSQSQSSQLQRSKPGVASLAQAQAAPCFTPEGSESEDDSSQASHIAEIFAEENVDVVFRPGPVNLTFLDGGVVKTATPGGQAGNAGVMPGWRIVKVDGTPVNVRDKESINKLFLAVKAKGEKYSVTFVKPGSKAKPVQSTNQVGSPAQDFNAEVKGQFASPTKSEVDPRTPERLEGGGSKEKQELAKQDGKLDATKVEPSVQRQDSPRVIAAKKHPVSTADAVNESAIEVTLDLELDSPREPKKDAFDGSGVSSASSPSKSSPGKKVSFAGEKNKSNLLDAFQAAVDHVVGQQDSNESTQQEDTHPRNVPSVNRAAAVKQESKKASDDADIAAGGRQKAQEDKSLPPISFHEVQQWLLQVEIEPDVLRPLREDLVPVGSSLGCLPGKRRSRLDIPRLSKDLVPDKDFTLYLSEAEVDFAETTHWRMLKAVHGGLTRSKACPFTGPHWKALGFESNDPRIDFRKTCGILNLVHLFFFLSHHLQLLENMYWLAVKNAPYPLASVSMRITCLVTRALLNGHLSQFCNAAAKSEDHGVFHSSCRLYGAALYKFYDLWQLPRKRDQEQALNEIAVLLQKSPGKLVSEFEKAVKNEEKDHDSLQSFAGSDPRVPPEHTIPIASPERSSAVPASAPPSGLTKLVQSKKPSKALE